MAGIFGNFMRGYDGARRQHAENEDREYMRGERDHLRGEREYQGQRRGVVDQRQDVAWDDSREDRTRQLGYEVEERPLQMQSLRNRAAVDQHNVDRLPVRTAREDAEYQAAMRGHQRNERVQNMQIASAESEDARQQALREWQAERQKIYQIGRSGRPEDVIARMDELYSHIDDGKDSSGVQVNDDGQYIIPGPDGKPQVIGGIEQLIEFADMYVSRPEVFGEAWERNRAERSQMLHGRNRDPAAIQEAEYVASLLPPLPGETAQEHRFRAYELTKFRNMERPEEARRKIATSVYESMSSSMFGSGQVDTNELNQRVEAIMGAIYSDASRGGARGQSGGGSGIGDVMRGAQQGGGQQAPRQAAPAGGQGGAPQQQAPAGDSPYRDGTTLRGPDGRLYVVENGQPVPVQ